MNKRPIAITVIGWIFIVAGAAGLIYHASEFKGLHPFDYDFVWIELVRLFAIVCGIFTLRGRNWARWGLVVWLGYHVILSFLHSPLEVLMHGALLGVLLYFLFRRKSSAYFRNPRTVRTSESIA